MKRENIVILGAGPAGLSAAWKISESGRRVIVLEKESGVGGICRTVRYKDFFFDLGGHRFITKDEEVNRLIKNLMGAEFSISRRKSVIRLRDRYFKYPLELKDLVANMDKPILIKSFFDYLYSLATKKIFNKKDISFEDWVINRFGKTLHKIYFGVYSEKLWGVSPKDISADWANQRISLFNLWDVFLRLMGKQNNSPKTYALEFLYPKMGIGRISERMAEEISKQGGIIDLNVKIKNIILEKKSIKRIIYEQNGETKELLVDRCISTIPIADFINSLEPAVSKEDLCIANSMRFRSIRFLNLIIDQGKISDNNWIYIPEKKFLFFRIQEPNNWSPYSSPRGKTSLILEISCDFNDRIWSAPDKAIFDYCVEGLEGLGLFDAGKIREYFTTRVQHGYPIYSLQYKDTLRSAMRFLGSIDNFISTGRQGLHRYNNMDHSIKMGLLTAEHIIKGVSKKSIFDVALDSDNFEVTAEDVRR